MLTTTVTLQPEKDGYPPLLLQAKILAPLHVSGRTTSLYAPCISIIGSRRMTGYGQAVLSLLVPPLVQAGITIVSGLAYGVDSQAHRVALKSGGKCVAVLGSGLQNVYPEAHQRLAEEIVEHGGCIISQFDGDEGPHKHHFPARNQIVAGLSRVTLIIEAGERSGTLITAKAALDAGRDVCVVPGDITRDGSRGILGLLHQGAHPVRDADDILALFPDCQAKTRGTPSSLTGSGKHLYDLVSQGHRTVDDLLAETHMTIHQLQSILTMLELEGHLEIHGTTWHPTSLS